MHGSARWLCRLGVAAASSVLLAAPAAAHVDYVTDGTRAGDAGELFRAVFADPLSVGLLAGGGLGVVLLVAGYFRFARSLPDIQVVLRTLRSYEPYLPWMLRLSIGLPLVGAGFGGYLFSPSVAADARLLQVGVGFLLLFGLATRIVAAVGLVAYLVALAGDATLLLASEYVAGFLAIVLVGPGQPSADLMLRRLVITDGTLASRFRGVPTAADVLSKLGVGRDVTPLVLRVFVGLNFVYLGAVEKWFNPEGGAAVVAKYDLTAVVPVSPELWVFGAGLVEVALGLVLLVGLFTRGAAATGFLMLTTTLFGLPDDPVLAHVTLFGLLSALLVTGGGPRSLDSVLVPALRQRFGGDRGTGDAPAAD